MFLHADYALSATYGVSRVSAGMMTKIVSASPVKAEVEIELPVIRRAKGIG